MMIVQKAKKVRIYPNSSEIKRFNSHFGAQRFIYNYFLKMKIDAYQLDKTTIGKYELSRRLTQMKKTDEFSWLKTIESSSLTNTINNLDTAYANFFRTKKGFPKFKKRNNSGSFKINAVSTCSRINIDNQTVKLSTFDRPIPFKGNIGDELKKVNSITISTTPSGKYYMSVQGDFEIEPIKEATDMIGLDLGIKDLVVDSNGNKTENPKFLRKKEKKLVFLNKKFSKSKKGSSNRNKKRLQLAKTYEKISNCRKDYIHKLTHNFVKNNKFIAIEDLAVKNMVKNKHLSKSISDASWGMLTQYLTYKAEWHSREVYKIERFYASSKTCNCCGHKNDELTLSMRDWTCEKCNTSLDRDVNAAQNILQRALLTKNNPVLINVKKLSKAAKKKIDDKLENAA